MLRFFPDMEATTLSDKQWAESTRHDAECALSEHAFNEDSRALNKFLQSHLGITAPLIRMNSIIWARLNELRDRNPQLCQLESAVRKSKMRRDANWKARAEFRTSVGLCR